ncbi:ABC transporter [candidate division WWE3 bacterium RIFOXYB1_FULL_43_24]|uniref:ABC transporter, ATPase subunit n=1 Tax=candidate division WWE3 bacterium GW2011_GWF1_42_14 TaxID=1619138 RepID=A0A0G1BJT7_UNCKA|nr:MAG: ABC transporter, ATPase subunit [candidate division WWE3 bacterium GW2011_GWA1_42_12]KKS34537.1 MAG: ABC transporter, ATPase subunit [candidate division WWE3 bacterium GW2011_GWD1_42_14]KKS37718.1 MAG: ABC transporter, ATPase subunit [candidate division WWE3 bacterium GW2011_GWF1_42_14]KKS40161.1 MAG: ABC transporter, ATPase subunit [candidate division WWE3 bacterium GW2011_GWE1_42_16]OGC68812.1 MAG: ABC transporter [candidate division WWE3 bacterium RIFOXYB1_FULL_43_24]OGC72397.1 MAG:
MSTILKVENVKRTFGTKVLTHALKEVSFEIKKGEFVLIMGKSGSGKSTLLHQMGLLDTPTSGEIYIGDKNVRELNEKQKTVFRLTKLGYIFQEYAILPELTAIENVYLPMMVNTESGNTPKREKAKQMLEMVDLGHRLNHYSNELSGGEQQRVAIARALINSPQILFADEPCANLDTLSTKTVLELLKNLNENVGQTIVMVSHDPDDQKYADHIISLEDGLIVSDKYKVKGELK